MAQHPTRNRMLTGMAVPGLLVLGLVLAACSSSSPSSAGSSNSSSSTGAANASATVDSTNSAKYGTILVDSTGRTLYMLTADTSTTSACTGGCVSIWAPLTAMGTPTAGSGLNASLLGTITRSDGSKQVTYNGHPLYTFVQDGGAGHENGEGISSFGGSWYVLNLSGTPVKAAVSGSSSTTSGGGYNY
jgi:predicted lipoprotein with Yx(FWY)xxD motif